MTLGLGFAGVGWLGVSLIAELPAFPTLHLAAVQDVAREQAELVAERYGSPWVGSDYAALLRAPGVDAVVICTPNYMHARQAQQALVAGKHVLVQKPLATRAADAEQTLQVAWAQRRLLVVDYSYVYLESMQRFLAEAARLGPLRQVRATFHNVYGPGKAWFFDPHLSGGGALLDLGVHLLDLVLRAVQPRTVVLHAAACSYQRGLGVEDAACLDLSLDGLPARIDVSWNDPRPQTEIALHVEGANGTARWENVAGSFFRFRTLRDGGELLDRETPLRTDTLRAFVQAVEDQAAPAVDVRVYRLIEQAYALGASGSG